MATSTNNQSEIPLWERQENESDKAFDAFCRYRDMGPERTLRKVAAELGKSVVNYEKYSVRWNWKKRVAAWTNELDRRRRDVQVKEVQDMAKRHAQQAVAYQRVLMLPVDAIMKRLQADHSGKARDFDGIAIEKLFDKVINAVRAFSDVTDVERKSRGEPNEITKQDITSDGKAIRVILPTLEPGNNEANRD